MAFDMNSILTIMKNSFAKEIRSRSFFVFTFFTLVLIVLMTIALVLMQEFFNENAQIANVIGGKSILIVFGIVNFWSLFISIVFGISAIQSDMDHMILPQILSHPISRTDYLIGRVLGAWKMVGIYYFVSLILAMTVFSITTGESSFSLNLIWALFPAMLRCLGLVVLSVIASLFMGRTTAMLSMIFFTFILSISNSHFLNYGMDGLKGGMLALKGVAFALHWLFPRVGSMATISSDIVYQSSQEISYLMEFPHFIVMTLFYLFILNTFFVKKDI